MEFAARTYNLGRLFDVAPVRDASGGFNRMNPSPEYFALTTALRSVATGDRARLVPPFKGGGSLPRDFLCV